MDDTLVDTLQPKFVDGDPLLIAGLAERFTMETGAGIPLLWQRFGQHVNSIPARVGKIAYGVSNDFGADGSFQYLCGVKVADTSGLPNDLSFVEVARQHYAVFTHTGHISGIEGTYGAIWGVWLPASSYTMGDTPIIERYDERFDPKSGTGGVEIWVPVKSKV